MEYFDELNSPSDYSSEDEEHNSVLLGKEIPKDNYHQVKLTFALLGCATLLPWNFLVTPSNYWNYKFRNTTIPYDPEINSKTHLQTVWEAYISIASNVPVAAACLLNAVVGQRFRIYPRLLGCCCLMLLVFTGLTCMVKVDSDSWINYFLLVTLALVFCLNGASGLFQGALGGLVSKFSSSYISILYVGQAVCGVLASVIEIIVCWVIDDPLDSALIYFLIADVILLAATVSYIRVTKTEYYNYVMNKAMGDDLSVRYRELTMEGKPPLCDGNIVFKIKSEAVTVFLTFFVTLTMFPSIVVLVEPSNPTSWTEKFFKPVVCFLVFNAGDLAGRISANWIKKPGVGSNLLPLMSLLRIALIPLIILCNVQPRTNTPVVFHSDVIFILLIATLGLSNGYIANLAFIHAPMEVPPLDKERVGSVMVLLTVISTSLGAIVSSGLINII